MTDPLSWSIRLGRWAGTQVRLHLILIVFVVMELLGAALSDKHPLVPTFAWLVLLLIVLALHELGHLAMAAWRGADPDDICLWPLGNLIRPSLTTPSSETVPIALAGLLTSFALALVTAIGLNFVDARFVWNPFGNPKGSSGAPILGDGHQAAALTTVWYIGWFGYLNWVVFWANLIPALPMDAGRIVRAFLVSPFSGQARDNMAAPWLSRAFAVILLVVGVIRFFSDHPGEGTVLISLAVIIEWMVRTEAHMIEDGGYFDDGFLGYDFSEGYTSLEGSAATVRPYRESALKRWRRRRSEQRRQRRRAREAAEEQRMDEILAKLHREGRAALTDEEHRFLVRVSARLRNRSKARD